MSKKYENICNALNHIVHLLYLQLLIAVSGCVSIFAFAFLAGVPTGNASSALGIKTCVKTAGAKKYKSIIKQKKERDSVLSNN